MRPLFSERKQIIKFHLEFFLPINHSGCYYFFQRFEILITETPKEVEFCVALQDYRDDLNNICLQKEETVLVLDRVSRPGMYRVVRFRSDGSRGDEVWVPSTILQRKKSTAEIIMPAEYTVKLKSKPGPKIPDEIAEFTIPAPEREVLVEMAPVELAPAPVAPEFTMPLEDQITAEGQPTQLDVRVAGIPEPEVLWIKDDRPIRMGERIHAEKEGDLYSLKISEVDIEDEGTYTCQATNEAGTATSMADLNVECKEIKVLRCLSFVRSDWSDLSVHKCNAPLSPWCMVLRNWPAWWASLVK